MEFEKRGPLMLRNSIKCRQSEAVNCPARIFKKVVFPNPDGPITVSYFSALASFFIFYRNLLTSFLYLLCKILLMQSHTTITSTILRRVINHEDIEMIRISLTIALPLVTLISTLVKESKVVFPKKFDSTAFNF